MQDQRQDFSLKHLFVPLTTLKAIHIIVIVGFIVYFNMLFNGFVWDDIAFISNNPLVHAINIPLLFGVNDFNYGSYYRPIPAVYFAILYSLFNNNVFFYHLLQMTLQIINSILLFFFFKAYFKKSLALFLSLIFLVHPINVESVSYIDNSITVLFFSSGMSALLLSRKSKLIRRDIVIIFGLLLLSLLTKETAILFVIMILLYRYFFKKDLQLFTALSGLVVALYLFIRFFIGNVYFEKIEFVPIMRLSLPQRLLNVPEVIWYYIKTFFYPAKLVIEQHWLVTSLSLQSFYLPLFMDFIFFLILCLFMLNIYKNDKERFKLYCFFFVWFALGILMVSQIVPLDMTVADRWFYFPMVGLLGMLGVIVQKHQSVQGVTKSNAIFVVCIAIILILSIRTVVRNTNWHDAITLYSHDAKIEDNFDIENTLGAELGFAGDYKQALPHLEKSINLFPEEISYANLALVYQHLNDSKQALFYYHMAIISKGYNIGNHSHGEETYIGYVEELIRFNEMKSAEHITEIGIQDYPSSPRMWLYKAYLEYKLRKVNLALIAAKKAYTLAPSDISQTVYNRVSNNQPLNLNITN